MVERGYRLSDLSDLVFRLERGRNRRLERNSRQIGLPQGLGRRRALAFADIPIAAGGYGLRYVSS